MTANSGGANKPGLTAPGRRGSAAGRIQRVTEAAATRPVIENSPSCANPSKLENSMAPKPASDVRTPRRKVGQMRVSVLSGELPGAVWVKR